MAECRFAFAVASHPYLELTGMPSVGRLHLAMQEDIIQGQFASAGKTTVAEVSHYRY